MIPALDPYPSPLPDIEGGSGVTVCIACGRVHASINKQVSCLGAEVVRLRVLAAKWEKIHAIVEDIHRYPTTIPTLSARPGQPLNRGQRYAEK